MKKNRILVVDDKEDNRYLLIALLQGHGFEVDIAAQGAEALDQARRNPPDLAVADILMPGMDGFALCREWKRDAALRTIPFVFYTATYTDASDRDFALSIGADDFIVKPEEPETLVARLQDILRRPGRPAAKPEGETEQIFLRQYNETLIRKLEDKMGQLEQDLAARRKAEASLRESEERFRELFDNMTSGVAVYEAIREGADFSLKDINQAGLAISALKRQDVIGKPVTEIFPGIREMGMLDALRRVWKTGLSENLPAAHYRDARLSHWYENRIYKLPSGEIVAVYDNVTERMETEAHLRFHAQLLDSVQESVVASDLEGRILYWGRGAEKLYGYAAAEVLGKPYRNFAGSIAPPDEEAFRKEIVATGFWRGEHVQKHRNGGTFWTSTFISLVLDGNGKSAGFIGIDQDISERKQAEEELNQLQTQLNQAQKMESVGRLAGGVAHDFNNMLGVILGHAELALEKTPPDQPLFADLQEIRKAAERSAGLTRQLLAFARKQTVAPKVLDLNETVEGMLKMLRRLIGEDIDLAWQPGQNLWPVKMDPSQIDQILANLCVNARDAIGSNGRITIETGIRAFDKADGARQVGVVPGEYVRLAVSDTGCGMDKETLANIFEPFFTTKGVGEGTGLGLATVYGAVKQNNGFITVNSEPNQGTTFQIYLPRHGGKRDPVRTQGAAEPAARGRETVLLVEDEPAILKITATMLERLGYTVQTAATPGEALRLAETLPGEIHLLMTDVVMPEMNGRDLAKSMLALYPHLRRLFMSGYTADVIAHHGVLADGVNFIQKPFLMKELAAKLRETLDDQHTPA